MTHRSIYGEAITEIHVYWSLRKIARHIGCDVSTVSRLMDDPRWTPSYKIGESIFELRDNIRSGRSRWGRMIKALRAHDFGTDQISTAVGVTPEAILAIEGDPTVIPQYDTASRLLELYRRHVSG